MHIYSPIPTETNMFPYGYYYLIKRIVNTDKLAKSQLQARKQSVKLQKFYKEESISSKISTVVFKDP
jgi:hypothetical protein